MTSPADSFVTTRWTRVMAAQGDSGDAQQALSDLCALYYAPVLRFLRASGGAADEAQELTHAFFAHVLEHRSLAGSDPARGRFRSYLLGALKHFLAKRRVHGARQKRGGGLEPLTLEPDDDIRHGTVPPAWSAEARDSLFDREWALAIIERTLAAIEQESVTEGGAVSFAVLKPWLSASSAPPAQAAIAAQLGMSEGALKVAIHRLRKRFREKVRREVAQTLQDPGDLDAEMQHLIAALSQ